MSLVVFLVLTIGGGLLVGFATRPGEWYVKLSKPWFTPPNSVFAPVWTLLYVMIAIAGWRTFMRDPLGATMIVWAVALTLNFIWSPIFFRLHRPAAALFVILALLAMIIAFIALSSARRMRYLHYCLHRTRHGSSLRQYSMHRHGVGFAEP